MTDSKSESVLFIRRKPDWSILLATGAGMIFAPIIMLFSIFNYFTDNIPIDGISQIFLISFILIGEIVLVRTFLWHYRGQEKLTVNSSEFTIDKIGTMLANTESYKLEGLSHFALSKRKIMMLFSNPFSIDGGEIQFEYYGELKYFGQSLTRTEAKEIIKQLIKIIEQRTANSSSCCTTLLKKIE